MFTYILLHLQHYFLIIDEYKYLGRNACLAFSCFHKVIALVTLYDICTGSLDDSLIEVYRFKVFVNLDGIDFSDVDGLVWFIIIWCVKGTFTQHSSSGLITERVDVDNFSFPDQSFTWTLTSEYTWPV